ncbi:MAG: translation initiation factor IF-2 [Prevotella sp.]|nr:translation initiation factor IF-2 [Prevotella sp.]MCM1075015.1 translation initiation factor IF-2 [Ruminococcus sp.]
MPTKISKIARELNVGVSTAADFLRKHNVQVDDNPNARIDDSAVELLYKEYGKDKDFKQKAEQTNRPSPRKPAKPEEKKNVSTAATPIGPKVVGKVQLDNKGNVVPPSAPKPAEKKPEPKPEVKPAPKPEPKPAPKPEPKPAPKPAEEPKPQPKPAEEPKPQPKPQQPKQPEKVEKPVEKVIKPEEKPAEDSGRTEIFRPATNAQTPQFKVVGSIDLSALNQTTRPKKRSKEERRHAANGQNGSQNNQNSSNRKKRQRIGKEKVDVEKTAAQPGFDGRRPKNNGQGGGQNQNNQGGKNRDGGKRGGKGKNAPKPVVLSDEDVQKQVKETLARLTNKTVKKSVKWRKEKREEAHSREAEAARREAAESKVIKITEFVTANDLANLMEVPVTKVIGTCMSLGLMVSINQRLDAETINIVAEEFGFTTEYVSAEVSEAITVEEDSEEDLMPRPPIVTVMGHVDHGKTSLLDYIRKANVIAGEAGGITQHIGAYNVKLNDGRHITFLDTPGHEAFTAMRARGAKVTDLAIIIVAADDNVMPQTIEAINHASAAGVPIVFAINKIDKPAANPDKIKEELSAMNYLVEDWGGKYQSQDISAKKGIGVEELMDKVLLEAEMLDLKANPNRNAIGSIIESSLDKGRGYVATVLVQNGTLRVGDVILAGTHFGKVKAMFNERNQRVEEAGPATPVLILGLNGAPTAGDTFNVLDTEQEAREIANKREQLQRELANRTQKRLGLSELARRKALGDFHELNLIVKGDVDGSIEALSDSLIKLSTPEVQVNVLHKGVGAISESDVTLAAASDAIIIGFQVRPSAAARREAEKEGVEIRLYSVIYKAIEEVKDAMEGMLSPEIREEITGTAEILQTFHISKVGTIAGAIVRDGKVKRTSKVRVIRDGIVVYTGELGSLKRFKDDAKEVVSGFECGLSVQNYNNIEVGDMIEAYEEIAVKKTL